MTFARYARGGEVDVGPPVPTESSQRLRISAQIVGMAVGLVAIAALFVVAASPGGTALRGSLPPIDATPEAGKPRVFSTSASVRLVFVVNDAELAAALSSRIAAGELIQSEHGAPSPLLTFEVLIVADADALRGLIAGLNEYDRQCVAVSCPAVQLVDLRSPASPLAP